MGNTLTIFDLDNTLIQGDSSTVWSQFMVREGLATQKGYLAREARLMADYDRGEMNIADYVALIQAPLAGLPKSDGPLRARGDPAPGLSAGVGAHSSSAGRGRADADYLRLG